MADNIAIFRINYKSDFILTLNSDAGWETPFCIKFWTGAPSQAYFAGYDGTTYTHCAPVEGDPTKLTVQFDDHHLPIGDLKFQIGYHFTVDDFPTSVEDEVLNQASVIIEVDDAPAQVMLDFNGETAPEIEFSLPAYANEAQRIANEQQRIENEQARISAENERISNEDARIAEEQARVSQEAARVSEFAQLKEESQQATSDANAAAALANEKAQLAADKAALADDKAALAQQKADYAETQGNYAKAQGDIAQSDHERAESDHTTAAADHTTAGNDHTRAESDHTRAESDHAAVEVYVDSLGAFDISAYHATGGVLAKYADLTAALGTNGANIPDALRKGGMSVKFVLTSDNKYVQFFCTTDEFTTDVTQWQGVDDVPTAGSENLVKSGGIGEIFAYKGITEFSFNIVGGIDATTGSDSDNSSYRRTGYIEVSQGMKLTYDVQEGSTGWCAIACYNSNGDYMSSVSIKGTSSGTFTIPNGVAKIRLATLRNYANQFAKFPFIADDTLNYPNVTTLKITDKAVTYPKLGNDVNAYLNRLLELNLDGGVSYSDGAIGTGTETNHKMTGYIKVLEGEKINYDLLGGSTGWAIVAAYNSSFEYVKASSIAGNADTSTPTIGQYVVPSGVSYLILSGKIGYTNSISFETFEETRVNNIVNDKISLFDGYLPFKNIGGLNADGTDSSHTSYRKTDLIAVSEGDIINASIQEGSTGWCALACYDAQQAPISDKLILGTGNVQNIQFIVPQGVSYIKIANIKSYTSNWATKNKVLRENDIEQDVELKRVNTVSVMKYPNILQQRGCIAVQMDLGYLDNARSGCDSMLEVMREYGLMSMDYAINITALQDAEIDKLLGRQKEGCEIIYHNRINSPSDFSNDSTLTVDELKEGVLDERLAMTQKGFTTFGVVANAGSLATRYKPTIDDIFFWSEYGSADIKTDTGAENSKSQYLSDHRIIRTGFEIGHSQYTPELEAEIIVKGKAWVDNLCTNKTFGVMYCHYYDRTTDNYHLYESVLRAMCAYIAEKISDGELWFGSTTECLNYLCR